MGGIMTFFESEEDKIKMRGCLDHYWNKGVNLYLDGILCTPSQVIEKYCLNEDMIYMADYVLDESGKLVELRYDRVTNQ